MLLDLTKLMSPSQYLGGMKMPINHLKKGNKIILAQFYTEQKSICKVHSLEESHTSTSQPFPCKTAGASQWA